MLVIRGVNIYPSEVERVLLEHTSLSPDYLLVVDERAAQSQLLALCEYAPGSPGPDGAGPDGAHGAGPAKGDLELRLREVLGVRVGVRVLLGARCRALRSARRCGSSGGPRRASGPRAQLIPGLQGAHRPGRLESRHERW